MKKVLTLILVLLIVAVLLAGAAMILGSTITNGTTNIPNVYVGELNVGGLTKSETRQLLIEQGWQEAHFPVLLLGQILRSMECPFSTRRMESFGSFCLSS